MLMSLNQSQLLRLLIMKMMRMMMMLVSHSLIILNPDLKLSCCLNQRRVLKVS